MLSECDNGKQCMKVSFKKHISPIDIVSARLWVFRRKKDLSIPSNLTISTKQGRHGGKHFVHNSHTTGGEGVDGWYATQLKIDDIIHQKKTPSPTESSIIEISDKNIVKFHALLKCDNCEFINKKSYTPFVSIDSVTHVRQIRRRSVSQDDCSGGCCRKSLKISFEELGWDFVYYPREYNAHYCQGNCSNKTALNKAKHTLYSAVGVKTKYCCSPKSLSHLNIFYMHEGSLIRRKMPDMVVKDCWCV